MCGQPAGASESERVIYVAPTGEHGVRWRTDHMGRHSPLPAHLLVADAGRKVATARATHGGYPSMADVTEPRWSWETALAERPTADHVREESRTHQQPCALRRGNGQPTRPGGTMTNGCGRPYQLRVSLAARRDTPHSRRQSGTVGPRRSTPIGPRKDGAIVLTCERRG